jgi:peroxiredoxin
MGILETIDTSIGSYAPDFELPGTDNQVHHLRRYLEKFEAVAVIAMSNHCPYVNLCLDRLKGIQSQFSTAGLTLIGLNGSDASVDPEEGFEKMKAFASNSELNFPYLWDPTQEVTRSFGVDKTPTALLIDKSCVVRYKGLVDDNPDLSGVITEHYLTKAISSLLKGEDISVTITEAVGTSLIWRN